MGEARGGVDCSSGEHDPDYREVGRFPAEEFLASAEAG